MCVSLLLVCVTMVVARLNKNKKQNQAKEVDVEQSEDADNYIVDKVCGLLPQLGCISPGNYCVPSSNPQMLVK